ncbi:MAG: transcription antitermination factor NusB [Sphaerochaetaceae bacterium]
MKGRHLGREIALTTLYALDFNDQLVQGNIPQELPAISQEELKELDGESLTFARFLIQGTIENLEEIDTKISRYSINRPLDKIDLIDRNILRISVYSLLYIQEIHPKIVITEAVQLSQEYSREVNYKFINGILDSMVKDSDGNFKN